MANEKRLIDANAFAECLERMTKTAYPNLFPGLLEAIDYVRDFPTVDAVEVVHGRWIVLAEFLDRTICTQCSVCGEEYTYKHGKLDFINAEYARYNFCPNCGAKMDGDGNGT